MARPRDTSWSRLAFVVVASIGLGVSALLLYEYLAPGLRLCGPGGGCDRVRHSAYAALCGVPTPAFGIAFFAAALVAGLWQRARDWLVPLALVGALAGIAFVALQAFAIGAWCKYCLVADTASVALAGISIAVARDSSESRVPLRLAAPIAVVCVALPVLLGAAARAGSDEVVDGPLPAVIAREQRPGVATIVEFLDFECPYCRAQHEVLDQVLADYGQRVRMVYKNVPLAVHSYARNAARAWCCAEEQGRGAALADQLFTSDDLTADGCATLAKQVGVDMDEYATCMASGRPDARIAADLEDARAVGVRGLPTFYVGDERMEGLKEDHVVRHAIDRALVSN